MTTYYVDNAGSDSNAGTSAGTAWQTLGKVAGRTYADGDSVLFKRGGVWRDAGWVLTLATAGAFTVDAYGTGAKPILSGGTLATSWTSYGGGSTSQLIANNDLETWSGGAPSSWTAEVFGSATVTQESTIIHGGSSSAKLHESSGSAEIRQTATVTAGHSYDMSFWHQEPTVGSQMKWGIQVVGGASNGYFLQADGASWGAGSQYFKPANATTWTHVLATVTAPTGATGLTLRVVTFSTAVTFYVDDVSIIESGAFAQPNTFLSMTIPSQPSAVRVGSILATLGTGKDALTQGQWWWGSGRLYYCDSAGNPTTNGTEVEATQRDLLDFSQTSIGTLTIQNLEIRHGLNATLHIAHVVGSYLVQKNTFRYMGWVVDASTGGIQLDNNLGSSGRITQNLFDRIDNDATRFTKSPNLEWDNNIVTHITGIQSDGVQGSDVDPAGNYSAGFNIHHNIFDFTGTNSPKGGILVSNNGAGHIHHNVTIGGVRGIAPTSNGTLCEYNTCIGHLDSATDNTASAIRFNESNCDSVTIRYNLIVNSDRGIGSYQSGGQTRSNMLIYNNTIVNPEKDGIKFVDAFSGRIANNIVYNPGTVAGVWIQLSSVVGGQTASADHNIFGPESANAFKWAGTSYSTIATWQAAVASATVNTSTDPLFNSPVDYKLQATSPAVDAGVIIDPVIPYSGAAPDIGAFESVPAQVSIDLLNMFNQHDRDAATPYAIPNVGGASIDLEGLWNQKYRDASVPFPVTGLNATVNIEALWNQYWRDASQPFALTLGGS